jgi:DNA repair protein RadC
MYLNTGGRVLAISDLTKGGIDSTTVDCRLVLAVALKLNATALIVGHNHPSGEVKPSNADLTVTRTLDVAAKLMGHKLFDHIIVGREKYYSFADNGLMSLHRDNKYFNPGSGSV